MAGLISILPQTNWVILGPTFLGFVVGVVFGRDSKRSKAAKGVKNMVLLYVAFNGPHSMHMRTNPPARLTQQPLLDTILVVDTLDACAIYGEQRIRLLRLGLKTGFVFPFVKLALAHVDQGESVVLPIMEIFRRTQGTLRETEGKRFAHRLYFELFQGLVEMKTEANVLTEGKTFPTFRHRANAKSVATCLLRKAYKKKPSRFGGIGNETAGKFFLKSLADNGFDKLLSSPGINEIVAKQYAPDTVFLRDLVNIYERPMPGFR